MPHRWNNTDLKTGGDGPVQFCGDPHIPHDWSQDDPSADCPFNRTLKGTLINTISKYVFFSTDKRYLHTFTEHEKYVIKKYSADLPKLMYKVMQQCRTMIVMCWWQGTKKPCMELFKVRRTDHGFCCSFNAVPIQGQL